MEAGGLQTMLRVVTGAMAILLGVLRSGSGCIPCTRDDHLDLIAQDEGLNVYFIVLEKGSTL